ncbi:gamma-glutamyl kinase [Actibacterium sp. XHP0104]|uniref:gamma-glutamyl kinase n=1 Tax=Actibacterium sp. XHP0104 TaxID=2984335 RepID=UPI0021E75A55|nr:gamma-glutamyl kinase [Actibacterium sp. XHP0104]MCV2881242.1 gamma-glutamyl kinase [Actibacterium sp. XHP0104]
MMVFWKARLAFLAVPKTGTHAYDAILSDKADIAMRHPPSAKHMNAQRFRRRMAPLISPTAAETIETLAVIREPLGWLGSWYRYRQRPELDGQLNSTAGYSFEEFVEGYLSHPRPAFARVGSQAQFVSDATGRIIVDHLFAYEDQTALRAFLAERLGFDVPEPPRLNVSSVKSDLSLPPALLERLQHDCAADFDLHRKLSGG